MRRGMLTVTITALLAMTAWADNWPQWRGPKNDGHSAESNVPTSWSSEAGIAWSLAMPGPGSSTPCIWGDTIVLTTMTPDGVAIQCIGTDGRERWQKPLGANVNIKMMRDEGGNLASASCSTDGERVYAFAGSGKLAAFDFQGNEVWSHDTLKLQGVDKFNIQFGAHWTPVLHAGVLYVTLLDRKGQNIFAFDAKSGKQKWKVERKSDSPPGCESPDVYSSPFVWSDGTRSLLIVHGNDYCTAHELADGAEVWRVAELNPKANYNKAWRAVSSPLVMSDLIVVPSCKKGVTVAIDPKTAKGTLMPGATGELWRQAKNTPDVPSPIAVHDVVYIMGETGTLYAYDRATGKDLFEEKITNMRHRANPVSAGGHLYFMGREGTMIVVKAGRTFEKVAENKLPDTFGASPAIANGTIYLRGWKTLYAIGAKR
jgi:outer membrane protein assembly factor BamB